MLPQLEFDLMPTQTPSTDAKRVGFVHLGCPKNLVDTETMLGLLAGEGHTIVADEDDAEVMLVNTCAFVEDAQRESVRHLVRLAEAGKKLMVTGCLAQKFQSELLEAVPEAGAVVGIDQVPNIGDIMRRMQAGERVVAVQQDRDYLLDEDRVRKHITLGASAYVKVAEGCDYACGFCIIPSMRGAFRSRPLPNVVDNVRALVEERGVKEVVLVGQDTTSYGKDHGTNLAQLLIALNEIEGLDWIRFMYAYPTLVSDELLDAIADCDRVVKYLDCPLQHSHPEMLKAMRRPVTDVAAFAARARERVPNIRLRTSFIVGYPGETQTHVDHLYQTIEAVQWDRLGVFGYSDVEGARSQALGSKVPKAEIQKRRREAMARQQPIAYRHNQALVGQTLPVLIDSINPLGHGLGRTQWDAPEVDNQVILAPNPALIPGELVHATITSATPYDLKARVML